jgi:hypothetical protein
LSKGIDFEIHIDIDTSKLLQKFAQRTEQAQVFLDNEVMRTTEEYVPMDTGTLARSTQLATKPGEGNVVYDTPYAKKLYYGLAYNFAHDKHPKATAKWLEASKAANMKDWVAGVNEILAGRNQL